MRGGGSRCGFVEYCAVPALHSAGRSGVPRYSWAQKSQRARGDRLGPVVRKHARSGPAASSTFEGVQKSAGMPSTSCHCCCSSASSRRRCSAMACCNHSGRCAASTAGVGHAWRGTQVPAGIAGTALVVQAACWQPWLQSPCCRTRSILRRTSRSPVWPRARAAALPDSLPLATRAVPNGAGCGGPPDAPGTVPRAFDCAAAIGMSQAAVGTSHAVPCQPAPGLAVGPHSSCATRKQRQPVRSLRVACEGLS